MTAIALNTNPTVDSPFVLQFAASSNDKQIIIYNLQGKELNVEAKVDIFGNALCLCYCRRCICFATSSSYFVHDLNSGKTRTLFPYDIVTTIPIVTNVGVVSSLLTCYFYSIGETAVIFS